MARSLGLDETPFVPEQSSSRKLTTRAGEAAAVEEKSAFVCSSIVAPSGAGDVFVRVANTGVYDLIITN